MPLISLINCTKVGFIKYWAWSSASLILACTDVPAKCHGVSVVLCIQKAVGFCQKVSSFNLPEVLFLQWYSCSEAFYQKCSSCNVFLVIVCLQSYSCSAGFCYKCCPCKCNVVSQCLDVSMCLKCYSFTIIFWPKCCPCTLNSVVQSFVSSVVPLRMRLQTCVCMLFLQCSVLSDVLFLKWFACTVGPTVQCFVRSVVPVIVIELSPETATDGPLKSTLQGTLSYLNLEMSSSKICSNMALIIQKQYI